MGSFRKFFIESNDKTGRQVKSSMSEGSEAERLYYNIMNPSNKIQCDDCKRDISKSTKILVSSGDYCPSCYANQSQYHSEYHVINKLDFPLLDHEWTADEELLLFEGLEKHGFGNWNDIADFIGTNKSREDVEEHYQNIYLGGKDYMPNVPILTKRDNHGRISTSVKDSPGRRPRGIAARSTNLVSTIPSRDRAAITMHHTALTVHHTAKNSSSPAQIVGYMPKRGDFQVEYDNDAQLLLAEMEFTDQDTEEEKAMKFRLIDIYNQKLNERIRRKQFVIGRGLLDLKEQIRLDRTRTREEKEMYNMLKVFARFNTPDDHEKLVQAIIKERQIRQRIEELKEFKKKGFKTLSEIEQELEGKKKKEEKLRKKQIENYGDKSKTRRMRKDPNSQKNQAKALMLTRQEQDLCHRLGLPYQHYTLIKQGIIRENIRQGNISKTNCFKMFKLDSSVIEGVYDYLASEDEIIPEQIEA